ncbi:MAG: hypothetical protein ACE5HD_08240 [Acidobacteriota bacterium]
MQPGAQGLALARNSSLNVTILDIMFPKVTSLDICQRIGYTFVG